MTDVPIYLLRAYAAMLPRLDAEEQLSRMTIMTAAHCQQLDEHSLGALNDQLNAAATGAALESPSRGPVDIADLAAIGISVTMPDPLRAEQRDARTGGAHV